MAGYKPVLPNDLARFFNIKRRTLFSYQKKINMHILYHKFNALKTVRERKNYLYSLKYKVSEEILDNIWEYYTEKLDVEYWTPKQNQRRLYLWEQT